MNFVRDEINGNVNWRAGNGRKSKKNVIMEYMRENPGITKKAAIARAVGADRNTVIKYYDEIVAGALAATAAGMAASVVLAGMI